MGSSTPRRWAKRSRRSSQASRHGWTSPPSPGATNPGTHPGDAPRGASPGCVPGLEKVEAPGGLGEDLEAVGVHREVGDAIAAEIHADVERAADAFAMAVDE